MGEITEIDQGRKGAAVGPEERGRGNEEGRTRNDLVTRDRTSTKVALLIVSRKLAILLLSSSHSNSFELYSFVAPEAHIIMISSPIPSRKSQSLSPRRPDGKGEPMEATQKDNLVRHPLTTD